ncbi:hypothetical protein NECID01_1528 [Nematocida sp. AWRm77]|nr:hypothetical protein NECID01_1528 [Nematocida sp. AWRm77]
MPIRGLEQEMTAKAGLRDIPVESLEKTKIGIDGAWFARKYGVKSSTDQVFTEGATEDILKSVKALVHTLEKNGCQAVWIWSGLPVRTGGQRRSIYYDHRRELLLTETSRLGKGEKRERKAQMGSLNRAVGYEETKRLVNQYLATTGTEVINAPYMAVAQGAYMVKQKYIQMFFGITDYFLFGQAQSLITNFVFKETDGQRVVTHATVMERAEVEKTVSLCGEELGDFLLSLGSEFCPTSPVLGAEEFVFEKAVQAYRALLVGEKPLCTRLEELGAEGKEYLEWFCIAKACVKHHPIIGEDGALALLESEHAPHNLSVIFGKKLADQVYLDFSKGLCSLEYIKGLAYGEVHALCSRPVFELAVPLINALYRSHITLSCIDIRGAVSTHESVPPAVEHTLKALVGADLVSVEHIPLAAQWLVLLLAKKNEKLLENVFVLNHVFIALDSAEAINWDVFEFSESAKFLATLIKDMQSRTKEEGVSFCLFDPINGWRMKEVLEAVGENRAEEVPALLVKQNHQFMVSLVELFRRNSLSPGILGTLEQLLSCTEHK